MEDKVSILITSGVGIEGIGRVPGDVVEVAPKVAAMIKAMERAVDATEENVAEWNAIHKPEASGKKSKKSGD